MYKICNRCKKTLPIDQFRVFKNGRVTVCCFSCNEISCEYMKVARGITPKRPRKRTTYKFYLGDETKFIETQFTKDMFKLLLCKPHEPSANTCALGNLYKNSSNRFSRTVNLFMPWNS